MTRLLAGCLMLLVLSACEEKKAAPALAPASTAPPSPNAAAAYASCASRLSSDVSLGAGEMKFTAAGPSIAEGSPGGTWPEVSAKLKADQPLVADVMKAAGMERCDFGFPRITARTSEQAMQPVIDTVASLRALARLLKADAARCWGEKDFDGAVDRVVAMYGMGRHVGGASLVVTSLADAAIIQMADDISRTMADGLTQEQKQRLRAALNRLDPADPAGLTRARRAEGDAAGIAQQLDQTQAKLMQNLAKTRQALGTSK